MTRAFIFFSVFAISFIGANFALKTYYFNSEAKKHLDTSLAAHSVFTPMLGHVSSEEDKTYLIGPHGFPLSQNEVKKPNIVVIGDSFVFGFKHRYQNSVPQLLQKKLPQYNVINWGGIGFNSTQSYMSYFFYESIFNEPEHVIWINGSNDMLENFSTSEYIIDKPMLKKDLEGPCLNKLSHKRHPFFFRTHSLNNMTTNWFLPLVLKELTTDLLDFFKDNVDANKILKRSSLRLCQEAPKPMDGEKVLTFLNKNLYEHLNNKLSVYFIPYKFRFNKKSNPYKSTIRELSEHGLKVYNLTPSLIQALPTQNIFLTELSDRNDDHFSVEAHEVITCSILKQTFNLECHE